jgi:hypothetical protein
LRDYAAGHGIIIPALNEAETPPHDTLTTRATPQTHFNLERLQRGSDAPSLPLPARAGGGFWVAVRARGAHVAGGKAVAAAGREPGPEA